MKILIPLLKIICMAFVPSQVAFSQGLTKTNSPVIMLPSAEISQGLDASIKNALARDYHTNFLQKFPEDLQLKLANNSSLGFLPNSSLPKMVSVVGYDNEPSLVLDAIKNSISRQVRTVIITKIDSEGGRKIEFKAKAINVVENSIITEKDIRFSTTELLKVEDKINKLANKMISKPLIKKPQLWTAVLAVGSLVWWTFENSKIDDRQDEYSAANTIGSVPTARKRAQDQEKQRDIAFGVTLGLSAITTILTIF